MSTDNETKTNINWYPGHMTKSIRMMQENLNLCDVIVELVDARIPYSSKNPDIDNLSKHKKRIILLNKADLADSKKTDEWVNYYKEIGYAPILCDSISGKGVNAVVPLAKELMKEKIESQKKRGRIFVPIRCMVVGIPNVGKSTFINKLVGKASTKTGDRPGVTRGKQWIKLQKDVDLLDTPGILWHKFEDQEVGQNLAYTGAINDRILDISELCCMFLKKIAILYPAAIPQRYGIPLDTTAKGYEILESIAIKRGFLKKGGEIDYLRCSTIVFDEFRGGKLGRITLEVPR